jgi:hypothetical protein
MLPEFEAQDAVKLLQLTLQNTAISDTSKLEYKDGEIREMRSNFGSAKALPAITQP